MASTSLRKSRMAVVESFRLVEVGEVAGVGDDF